MFFLGVVCRERLELDRWPSMISIASLESPECRPKYRQETEQRLAELWTAVTVM